jgi:uncharacterized tellurite resistance protein B-like protein
MSFQFTAEEMKGLGEAQLDALVDVVIAGVLADGTVDDAEVARVDAELKKVPWGRPDDVLDEKVRAAFTKINAFTKPEEAFLLVKAAADTITDPGLREKTFALLARVMYADKKMSPNEKTVLTVFATAFQIPLPKLAEISESVKKGE